MHTLRGFRHARWGRETFESWGMKMRDVMGPPVFSRVRPVHEAWTHEATHTHTHTPRMMEMWLCTEHEQGIVNKCVLYVRTYVCAYIHTIYVRIYTYIHTYMLYECTYGWMVGSNVFSVCSGTYEWMNGQTSIEGDSCYGQAQRETQVHWRYLTLCWCINTEHTHTRTSGRNMATRDLCPNLQQRFRFNLADCY